MSTYKERLAAVSDEAALAMVGHMPVFFGRPTMVVNKTAARRIIETFETRGRTSHSADANLLPIVLRYCEAMRVPYVLRANPGQGYYIERHGVGPDNELPDHVIGSHDGR